jgi:hypothetical protein
VKAPTRYANLTITPIPTNPADTTLPILTNGYGHFVLIISNLSSKSLFFSSFFLAERFFFRPDSSSSDSEDISAFSLRSLNYSRPVLVLGTAISSCSEGAESEEESMITIETESTSESVLDFLDFLDFEGFFGDFGFTLTFSRNFSRDFSFGLS